MKRQRTQAQNESAIPTEPVTRVLRSRSRSAVLPDSTSSSNQIVSSPVICDKIFQSCLKLSPLPISDPTPRSPTPYDYLQSLSRCELDDESWLSSHFIDFVVSQFAKYYNSTYFMSIDFAILGLSSITKSNSEMLIDLTGKKINYKDPRKSIVFVCNSRNIHWNLIRVIRYPSPVLELFEPLGKPSNRHGGLNYRQVPRQVIEWLDMCCPLLGGKSWLSVGYSAITKQQQFTTFDCGVACLLYAEKCGQEQSKEDINNFTTQDNITEYRRTLKTFTKSINGMCIDLIV